MSADMFTGERPPAPDTEDLFAKAMDKALSEGKGWTSEAERQAYIDKVTADDYLPAIFCSTPEELANAPDADAFQGLLYDNQTAASNMVEKKEKANEKLRLGRQNEARNFQYFREAVDCYAEAIGWSKQIKCTDEEGYEMEVDGKPAHDKDRTFTTAELGAYAASLYSNRAMAHVELKNWGFCIGDSKEALATLDGIVLGAREKEDVKLKLKQWYRMAKAHETRRDNELALDCCEAALKLSGESENPAVVKVLRVVSKAGQKERSARQKKEKERVGRAGKIKAIYKWAKEKKIKVGRIPLVSTVDEEDEDDDENGVKEIAEKRWNHIQVRRRGKASERGGRRRGANAQGANAQGANAQGANAQGASEHNASEQTHCSLVIAHPRAAQRPSLATHSHMLTLTHTTACSLSSARCRTSRRCSATRGRRCSSTRATGRATSWSTSRATRWSR